MDLFFHWKDESEVILKWGKMKSESRAAQLIEFLIAITIMDAMIT